MNFHGMVWNNIVLNIKEFYDFYRRGDEILAILLEMMLIDKNKI